MTRRTPIYGVTQRTPGMGVLRLRGNAWLSLLRSSATLAWDGSDGLTLANWRDVVQGVVATAGGSGTTLDTLNGRTAAVFNGSGNYVAPIGVAIPQPNIVIFVGRPGPIDPRQSLYDGTGSANRQFTRLTTTGGIVFAGSVGTATFPTIQNTNVVVQTTFNGASSSIAINGVSYAVAANVGANPLNGVIIGSSPSLADPFIGPIAHISIYHGDKLANAATVASAAQQYYGIAS